MMAESDYQMGVRMGDVLKARILEVAEYNHKKPSELVRELLEERLGVKKKLEIPPAQDTLPFNKPAQDAPRATSRRRRRRPE